MKELVTAIAYIGFWMNSKIWVPLLLQQEDESVKKETHKATNAGMQESLS